MEFVRFSLGRKEGWVRASSYSLVAKKQQQNNENNSIQCCINPARAVFFF
jgi:hypothetical protein